MKNQDDELDFLEEGDKNPVLMIVGGAVLLILIVVLCAVIWKAGHKEEGGIGDNAGAESQVSGPAGDSVPGASPGTDGGSEDGTGSAGKVSEPSGGQEQRETGAITPGGGVDGGALGGMQQGNESGITGGEGSTATMDFKELDETVTAKERTNLRTEPSTASDDTVAVQLKNGETARRTGINEDSGWSRVEYNGQTLYAVSRFLTTDLKSGTAAGNGNAGQETGTDGTGQTAGMDGTDGAGQTAGSDGTGGAGQAGSAGAEGDNVGGSSTEGGGPAAPKTDGDTVTTIDGRKVTFTPCDDIVSPKIEVNLRGEPSTSQGNDTVHYRMAYGENAHRTGVSEEMGWSRVEYNGEVLYAVTSNLYVVEEE